MTRLALPGYVGQARAPALSAIPRSKRHGERRQLFRLVIARSGVGGERVKGDVAIWGGGNVRHDEFHAQLPAPQ